MGDLTGFDPEQRQRRVQAISREMRAENPHRSALDADLDTALTAAYLALSIDCERVPRPNTLVLHDVLARHGAPPLMRYRVATCGIAGAAPVGTLREADPRWVDTLFFEGRYEAESRAGDPARGAMLLTAAREAFPASHAIVLALARAHTALADYEAALARVEEVLAEVPTHRDALLARVENLSYLNRYDEAIATASRMIELGTWHLAVFSAGMVHVEQQAWLPASAKFSRSMTCYTTDAAGARAGLARIEASDQPPARKARLAAAEQKRIASSEHLAAQSAFNAAQGYLRLGQKQPALTHVDAATAHPLMRDKAASLKVVIEKMR